MTHWLRVIFLIKNYKHKILNTYIVIVSWEVDFDNSFNPRNARVKNVVNKVSKTLKKEVKFLPKNHYHPPTYSQQCYEQLFYRILKAFITLINPAFFLYNSSSALKIVGQIKYFHCPAIHFYWPENLIQKKRVKISFKKLKSVDTVHRQTDPRQTLPATNPPKTNVPETKAPMRHIKTSFNQLQ